VQILDLDDTAECEASVAQLIAGTFEDIIWLTGEGLRCLLLIAERSGCRAPFVEVLAACVQLRMARSLPPRCVTVPRGAKFSGALQQPFV
jgi:hypothetical protein